MSDKRQGFRHLFTIGFFAIVFIAIGGFIAFCAYLFIGTFTELSSISPDPKPLGDSFPAVSGCDPKQPGDSAAKTTKNVIITGDEYHPIEIHDSLFSFRIIYDSVKFDDYWYHKVRSISIYRLAGQEKIQTVAPPEPFDVPPYQHAFEVEDMNFDGYNDFRAMSGFMVRGQTFYYFWLYDPSKGKFKEDTFMTNNMWDVAFDHEAKTVTSNQRHPGPFNEVNEVYSWENGKLVLQHKEQCDPNPFGEDGDITMTRRINGKLITRTAHFDTIPITNVGSVIYEWEKLK